MTAPAELTVDGLVAQVMRLLDEADTRFPETTGNKGRTPGTLATRANILATLAVAMGIRSQQQASAATSAELSAARQALADITARVARLEQAQQTLAVAVVDVGALAIGTRDVAVPWGRSLGDVPYLVEISLDRLLVGQVTATTKSIGATSAVVTISAGLAVLTSTKLHARAYRGG